ncbi:MAG: serine/threonine-protein kinase [Slackia sp.]|nr:serine/threonine-protein kinase [Slackia sp.]
MSEHLDALQREECYRVDAVLKESPYEITQRVMFVGRNGAEQGPFIRKYIARDSGLGAVYARMCEAQRCGRRFRFLPRISDCYACGEDDVVIMEYVHGETLQDAVRRCGPSVAFAADVFPRLCDAVLELHEGFDAPIIHRDLKPSNIMISRDGLTIVDLGIARFYKDGADDDTRHFGTRAYAPPEQFGYGQTTVRSDVYALGMLLYFCLAGETPDVRVRDEGFFADCIPEPLRAVLMRATEFDPARRFGDVRELRSAFCRAAQACGYAGLAASTGPDYMMGLSMGIRGLDYRLVPTAAFEPAPSGFVEGCRHLPASPQDRAMYPESFGGRTPLFRADGRFGAVGRVQSALRHAVARVKDAIPKPVVSLWNTAVVVAAALLLTGCVFAAFSPNERDAAYPWWFLALEYLVVGASSIVFLAYALIDKRDLYALFPHFPRFPWWRQALFLVLYVLFAFGLLGAIGPSLSA